MKKLFGTDGIRGVANRHPMTPEMAVAVGRAIAAFFKTDSSLRVVIGKDTRISGDMLECALAAGLCSMGADACLCGVLPTPAVAAIAAKLGACAGIVVSASHNPYADNGIKVFDGNGFKLSESVEQVLESRILKESNPGSPSYSQVVGRCDAIVDALDYYGDFLVNSVPDLSLDGLRLVLDCSHGATFQAAPDVFSRLGAEISVLSDKPDGVNINAGCGSQHPEALARAVVKHKAHAGFAFDGDGDRVIAVDETGRVLTGDQALAVCAVHMKQAARLAGNRVVATVMSNMGLKIALKKQGIHLFLAQVGDRYVMEMMKSEGAVLGGEDSGHTLFLDRHTTGDGILSALQLLEAMRSASKPLSELAGIMSVFPQILINVPVCEKPDIETVAGIKDAVGQVESRLGDEGRVLIRYSGTQPLCRVMVEGPSQKETRTFAEQIAEKVRVAIGKA
ncbi:MAG: phosphoglucosamine mutase [Desulfatirhabdiaceae bacterium]|nr:phosphoglucosamine mutase [Desulfatirhabdiaceae bacterium]